MVYTIVWHHAGNSTIAFSRPSFPCWEGWDKGFCSKSQSSQEKKYTWVVHHASSWCCHPCNNGIVTIDDAQVSLPLSGWHHCHRWCAGISVIVKLASLPLLLVVKLALLPLSWWHHCHWCAGIFANVAVAIVALITMACCCHWCAGISAIVKLASSPLLLVVELALLPLSWRHHHHLCAGIFANVAIAIVTLMTMVLLLLLMCRCPCCHQACVVTLLTMALSPCNSVVALVTMALLPSSSWHCCPHCNGIIIIIDAQASLQSIQWHCCRWCTGVFSIVAMAIVALVAMASLP